LTLRGSEVFAMPRAALLRSLMLNHWYHHRGQLTVYLRLLDVPLPVVYGRTADENPSPEQAVSSNGMAYDLGLADRIRVVMGRLGDFSERKMFGGLCFLVNGHMCCGIVKSDLMLCRRLRDRRPRLRVSLVRWLHEER